MLQKLKNSIGLGIITPLFLLVAGLAFLPSQAYAVNPSDGTATGDTAAKPGNCSNEADLTQCDLIHKYVNPLINFLAAFVGVAVVVSIIVGGVQYGSSGGDPQRVTAAKNRIRNALIALLAFIFLYTMLNFLIPGGIV